MGAGIASGHEMGIKQQGRGMGLQAAAIASQIDLNNSQAEKNRADAKKYQITNSTISPYGDLAKRSASGSLNTISPMFGLAIKTYQSDIFNNWINTEWLDGEGGINEVTAIDVSSGSFTMDTLNLAKKVYDMLNRIAATWTNP